MRIISGQYRGKKLFSPASDKVRPTSDRAREALFNILHAMLENPWPEYKFLDIFSGTGAVGLEALSRGAKQVCLIDIAPQTALKNAALFPAQQEQIRVIRADAQCLPFSKDAYDIVFLDAPYKKGLSETALLQLHAQNWLKHNALCLVEVEKSETLSVPECYQVFDERIYGLAKIIFMRYIP